jgi:endonuclease YncB( thermonuclease family)
MAVPENHLMAFEEPDGLTIRVPVLKVFDGDGFLTRIISPRHRTAAEVVVRFGFIDAPELGQPGGHEAQRYLEGLIGGRWLDIGILTKMNTGGIVDRHGRIVCIPYLIHGEPRDGDPAPEPVIDSWDTPVGAHRNIELEMVLNGWAWVLDRYEPDECYFDALEDAQRHRRGIWQWDDNVHPWDFKRQKYRQRKSGRTPSNQPNLFDVPSAPTRCPRAGCDGNLVKRSGRFGPFVGCTNYPVCKHSSSGDR